MANINAPEVDYFLSYAGEIKGKLDRLKNLINNRAANGNYHEEIIRVMLRNFLSKRFSVKTGFIYRDSEHISKQIDIMIVDENEPAAYIFQEGDFAVVLPKAVVTVLEVKTSLDKASFRDSVLNIKAAKELFELPAQLTGIIFGYRSSLPSDKNLDAWFKDSELMSLSEGRALWPNAIEFFERGCLLFAPFNLQHYHKFYRYDNLKNPQDDVGWHLSIVLALVLSSCENKVARERRTFSDGVAQSLIQAEGAKQSIARYAFGEGKTDAPSQS